MNTITTRRRGSEWVAFYDEKGGARGYGPTEEDAVRNLKISFPDDGPGELPDEVVGPGFPAAARATILAAAVKDLRTKLAIVAPDIKQGE